MNSLDKLFEKYLQNKCSEEELNQLLDYFAEDANSANLQRLIQSRFDEGTSSKFSDQNLASKQALDKVDRVIYKEIASNKRISFSPLLKYVAVFISVAFISLLLYRNYLTKPIQPIQTVATENPVVGEVTLKLASGKQIALGRDKDINNLPQQVTAGDGIISYEQNIKETAPEINELSTSAGGKYQLVLADGTKVTLNSMSTLKYPSSFTANERIVELSGEAFFEVAHATQDNIKVPFIVKTLKQKIQVLGTKFNVSSYSDDVSQTTTLVSGKVSVTSNINSEKIILLPGQQFITNKNNSFIRETNTESATAWVLGNFLFEDMQLIDILKQLSRWYGINVDYTNVPQTRYNVFLSKSEKLPVVLKYLEDAGKIKFTIKENTIYIK